jgi:hypothetical protein
MGYTEFHREKQRVSQGKKGVKQSLKVVGGQWSVEFKTEYRLPKTDYRLLL